MIKGSRFIAKVRVALVRGIYCARIKLYWTTLNVLCACSAGLDCQIPFEGYELRNH